MPAQPGQRSLEAMAEPRSGAAFRAAGRMALGRGKLLNTLEMTLEPLVHVVLAVGRGARGGGAPRRRAHDPRRGHVLAHLPERGAALAVARPRDREHPHRLGRARHAARAVRPLQRLPRLLPPRNALHLVLGGALVPDRRAFLAARRGARAARVPGTSQVRGARRHERARPRARAAPEPRHLFRHPRGGLRRRPRARAPGGHRGLRAACAHRGAARAGEAQPHRPGLPRAADGVGAAHPRAARRAARHDRVGVLRARTCSSPT